MSRILNILHSIFNFLRFNFIYFVAAMVIAIFFVILFRPTIERCRLFCLRTVYFEQYSITQETTQETTQKWFIRLNFIPLLCTQSTKERAWCAYVEDIRAQVHGMHICILRPPFCGIRTKENCGSTRTK